MSCVRGYLLIKPMSSRFVPRSREAWLSSTKVARGVASCEVLLTLPPVVPLVGEKVDAQVMCHISMDARVPERCCFRLVYVALRRTNFVQVRRGRS